MKNIRQPHRNHQQDLHRKLIITKGEFSFLLQMPPSQFFLNKLVAPSSSKKVKTSTPRSSIIIHQKTILVRFLTTTTQILFCFFFILQPSLASQPSQGCKLIRKFVDATGEVDMRTLFLDSQFEDFLRQNPSIICIAWRIVGYDREAVRIQLRDFDISRSSQTPVSSAHEQRTCWDNSLYIKDSDTALAKERPAVSTISGPYCGHLSEPVFWWSNGNDVIIEYHIRSLEQAKRDRVRFQFSVLTPMHGCGYEAIIYSPSININASTGEISSPFDRTVASHSRCYWSIVASEDSAFSIEFLKYNIDANAPFILTINDVFDPKFGEDGSTIIGPRCCDAYPTLPPSRNKDLKNHESYDDEQCLCLKGNPPPILSSSNVLHIYYESRTSFLTTVNQGFTLKWRQVKNRKTSTISTTTTSATTSTTTPAETTAQDIEFSYDEFLASSTTTSLYEIDDTGNNDDSYVTPQALFHQTTLTSKHNVTISQEQSNVRMVTMVPQKNEIATNIPAIYLYDTGGDNAETDVQQKNSRPARQRQTTEQITENAHTTAEMAHPSGEETNKNPKAVHTGPISMFGASSRVKTSSSLTNCASLHHLSFFAPFVFAFGKVVLLKERILF